MRIAFTDIADVAPGRRVHTSELPKPPSNGCKKLEIEHRFIAHREETIASLATETVGRLFEISGIRPDDCDALILSTRGIRTREEALETARRVAAHRALHRCRYIDAVNAACCGSAKALRMGNEYIERTGTDKNVLIVCAELPSRTIDYAGEKIPGLFADRGAALSLQRQKGGHALLHAEYESMDYVSPHPDREPHGCIYYEDVENALAFDGTRERRFCLQFGETQNIFTSAVDDMVKTVERLQGTLLRQHRQGNGAARQPELIVVPHQANAKMVRAVRSVLSRHDWCAPENVKLRIDGIGNCESATTLAAIKSLMDERSLGSPGDIVVVPLFGGPEDFQRNKVSRGAYVFEIGENGAGRTGEAPNAEGQSALAALSRP